MGLAAWAVRNRSPPPWRAPRCWSSSASRAGSSFVNGPAISNTSTTSLDEALAIIDAGNRERSAGFGGLVGNAAEIFREMLDAGIVPDIVTDQTSAHDPAHGYLPLGWTVDEWLDRQERDPAGTAEAAKEAMAEQVRAILAFKRKGAIALDYGNNIRAMAKDKGVDRRLRLSGLCRSLCAAAVLRRQGAVSLGGAVGRS